MFIGLDIGTSGTKAALIDEKGTAVDLCQVPYGFSNTDCGYRELNGDTVWKAVKTCLQAVGAKHRVRTITVSALGEAVIPINRQGEPLNPGITGTDIRGAAQLSCLEAAVGRSRLTDITGLNLSTIYSANKLMWIREHKSRLYEHAWKFVTFQDFILYKLTGQSCMDYSMASRTLLFDVKNKKWSKEILKAAALDQEKLSEPVRAGTCAGVLIAAVAEELGLKRDVKVIVGTHDHICNAIGCGAVHYGDCANTVGTTEGLTAILERQQLHAETIEQYQISCEPFVVPSIYNTVAWSNTSGVLLKWFAVELLKKESNDEILSCYRQMNESMEPEPTRLLVLPHFSGAATPYMNPNAKGAIIGLTLHTRTEDIYKAIMEGTNLELSLILDCLRRTGLRVPEITATGGALSRQLLQIKADVLGIPVHTVKNQQTGTLGGAILGAVADGVYTDLFEAVKEMVVRADTYEPDKERNRFYKERRKHYRELYQRLKDINEDL